MHITNTRLLRFLAFLRLLSPANFMHSLSYLRKYGIRSCFARTVFLLSLALGRRSVVHTSLTFQLPVHKADPGGRGLLKHAVPNSLPLPDACQDALRLELTAIKDELADSLQRGRKINE